MKISSDLMNTEDLNIILLKLQLNQSRANLDVRDGRTRPFRGRLETLLKSNWKISYSVNK